MTKYQPPVDLVGIGAPLPERAVPALADVDELAAIDVAPHVSLDTLRALLAGLVNA